MGCHSDEAPIDALEVGGGLRARSRVWLYIDLEHGRSSARLPQVEERILLESRFNVATPIDAQQWACLTRPNWVVSFGDVEPCRHVLDGGKRCRERAVRLSPRSSASGGLRVQGALCYSRRLSF